MIATDPTKITEHPLQSNSPAFNRMVKDTTAVCEALEAGQISGAEFNDGYRGVQDQYLIDIGIMDAHDPTLRR
jgi:hypothetical protein